MANGWGWPFPDKPGWVMELTDQKFGYGTFRANGYHDGVDFGGNRYRGDIHAVHGGKVTRVGWYAGFLVVTTESGDGYTIVYQEFGSSAYVNVGDEVQVGDPIAYLAGTHLHLGITTLNFEQAFAESFSPAGGWLDPVEVITNGAPTQDTENTTQDVDQTTKVSNTTKCYALLNMANTLYSKPQYERYVKQRLWNQQNLL